MRPFVGVLLGLSMAVVPGNAVAVELDKLSDCADLAKVVSFITAGVEGERPACRGPKGALEERIVSSFHTGRSGPDTCLLLHSPAPMLGGFACILVTDHAKSASVTCFKPAEADAAETFHTDYRATYATKGNKYLETAGACSVSNGDASLLRDGQMDPLIMSIAKLELGFGTKLRMESPATGMASHAFASVDTGQHLPVTMLEYVSAFVDMHPKDDHAAPHAVGSSEWRVEVDPATEFIEQARDFLRANDAYLAMSIFSITSNGENTRTDSEKIKLFSSWRRDLLSRVMRNGGRELSDHEKESGRITVKDFESKMPYQLKEMLKGKFDPRVDVVLDEHPDCGPGATSVTLVGVRPTSESADDYGAMIVQVLGMGGCGHGSGRYEIDDTLTQISNGISEILARGEK